MIETMEVVVTSIIEPGEDFAIFSAKTTGDKLIRIVANCCIDPVIGETYRVKGTVGVYQDTYGRRVPQIKTKHLDRTKTSGKLMLPWLRSLPGIGKTRAENLWKKFGVDLLNVLQDPAKLEQVASIIEPKRHHLGLNLAMLLNRAIVKKLDDDECALKEGAFRLRLEGFGVTDARAVYKIWRMIGSSKTEEAFISNPYMIATLFPWKTTDRIGQTILKRRGELNPGDHAERLVAAVDNCWRHFLLDGHTAAFKGQLLKALTNRLKSPRLAISALNLGEKHGAYVKSTGNLLRAPGAALMEDEITARLESMAVQTSSFSNNKETIVRLAEKDVDIFLYEEQRTAVINLLDKKFNLLQGGAGTGKTFTMKILAKAWELMGGRVELACLAGKAAMQLRRSTNRETYTIAKLLKYLWKRREYKAKSQSIPKHWPYLDSTTLLIIDESSMVDVGTWHEILGFMPEGCSLTMVGDNGQLPPVGIGQIYHDLVTNHPNIIRLNTNRRQKNESGIPEIASAIREGFMPQLKKFSRAESGVQIFPCHSDDTKKNVVQIKNNMIAETYDNNILVCAALRNTVDAINEDGSKHNHKKSIRVAPSVWIAAEDPVVYTANRYKDELYNGLLGRVVDVSEDKFVKAKILWEGEDKPRDIGGEEISDVELAYAITTHKVQGSSAPRIIVPLEHTRLVTRQWLYTAVTRAEDQCVFVGDPNILSAGLKRQTERITGLFRGPTI